MVTVCQYATYTSKNTGVPCLASLSYCSNISVIFEKNKFMRLFFSHDKATNSKSFYNKKTLPILIYLQYFTTDILILDLFLLAL